MDGIIAAADLHAILGRNGSDFVGIDNDGLDFSQLEDFINGGGTDSIQQVQTHPHHQYFDDALTSATTNNNNNNNQSGPITVITDNNNKRTVTVLSNHTNPNNTNNNGHPLPDSPPDSSSEHPYSPSEGGCKAPLHSPSAVYTSLYKPVDMLVPGDLILVENGGAEPPPSFHDAGHAHLYATASLIGGVVDEGGGVSYATPVDEGGGMLHLGYGGAQPPATGEGDMQVYVDLESPTNNQGAVAKKRKLSSTPVKSEPERCSSGPMSPMGGAPLSVGQPTTDDEYAPSEACLSESQYQCIRFGAFQQPQWHALCDQNLTELPTPHYRVDADKGFNFSNADDAFVCQKKNHFQITCHVQLLGDAQFVKTSEGFQKISSFHIHFYGVKHDCPSHTIRVEQSQSDRSKKAFHPVLIELVNSQVTKVTVGRLHFSETTSNNMRKKGKPNPDQRYFQLVVGLHAHTTKGNFPVVCHASQKIIVRASNPGQFESDGELCWQKGQSPDSIFHNGRIGINTDRPDESLVVHGNIKVTGHIVQPSDLRAKTNIVECDTREQLRNVQKLRVVRYDYEPAFASQLSSTSSHVATSDTGVIAQEVAEILPEAVRRAGDLVLNNGKSIDNFLVVNKERIFMENIGAVKELCKVTDNLETRIGQLERISRRLNKLKRDDSLKSDSTASSTKTYRSSHSKKCKCSKHHRGTCRHHHGDELCSSKFIQIVIIVLVLIMAFCLAAITTLYLMEASRHTKLSLGGAPINNNFNNNDNRNTMMAADNMNTQFPSAVNNYNNYNNYGTAVNNITNKRKSSKAPYRSRGRGTVLERQPISPEVSREVNVIDSGVVKRPSLVIGRPRDCLTVDQDLDNGPCPIYCCPNSLGSVVHPPEVAAGGLSVNNKNKNESRSPSVVSENNKIGTQVHSNVIDKEEARRTRRETYESGGSATYDDDDHDGPFSIVVEGRDFNTTLTNGYLEWGGGARGGNFSISISKYMPDQSVKLIFSSTRSNELTVIEYCNSGGVAEGVAATGLPGGKCFYRPDETGRERKVEESVETIRPGVFRSVTFEVDMAFYKSKVVKYRASVGSHQAQNLCKNGASHFVEYNFHFNRECYE